jgi:hypothetical protein
VGGVVGLCPFCDFRAIAFLVNSNLSPKGELQRPKSKVRWHGMSKRDEGHTFPLQSTCCSRKGGGWAWLESISRKGQCFVPSIRLSIVFSISVDLVYSPIAIVFSISVDLVYNPIAIVFSISCVIAKCKTPPDSERVGGRVFPDTIRNKDKNSRFRTMSLSALKYVVGAYELLFLRYLVTFGLLIIFLSFSSQLSQRTRGTSKLHSRIAPLGVLFSIFRCCPIGVTGNFAQKQEQNKPPTTMSRGGFSVRRTEDHKGYTSGVPVRRRKPLTKSVFSSMPS